MTAFLLLSLLVTAPEDTPTTAVRLWEQGQNAMLRSELDHAITCYHKSLELDPTLCRNFLSLAAAHLQKDETERALPWLARYVALQPDHFVARSHYAELLCKTGRLDLAAAQFTRFVADVQRCERQPIPRLIQAHMRLMEIAHRREDEYHEELHRGIGLYWLACLKAETGDTEAASPESLLCQATIHLQRARRLCPDLARPCWYLHRVWQKLGQDRAAQRWLHETKRATLGPPHDLTPSEAQDLELAQIRR